LIGLLLLFCPAEFGSENARSNIICREQLSIVRRNELSSKLRRITGWPALKFDETGALLPGEEQSVGGSRKARDLLARAISGATVLILEDASNRADVIFAKVVEGYWKTDPARQTPVYVVLIDFADFDHLMGDSRALSAFDVGWGVLHEIDHVVNDSVDPDKSSEAGECEGRINEMRRECNLPQRTDYFFTFFPHADESAFVTKLVRLAFDQEDTATNKRHRYWLIWDATQVGGLNQSKQIAELR
jgi:hypothetical protein